MGTKIKVNKKYKKIAEVASKDESRLSLRGVRIDGDRAIATDGRVLVAVPIEVEGEKIKKTIKSKVFSSLTVKSFRDEIWFEVGDKIEDLNKDSIEKQDFLDLNYPSYEQVIPEDVLSRDVTITLNAELLLKIQKALGVGGVQLCVKGPSDPIVVRANNEKGFGILMPMRTA